MVEICQSKTATICNHKNNLTLKVQKTEQNKPEAIESKYVNDNFKIHTLSA